LTWEGEDTTLTLLAHYQRDDAGWGTQFLPASGTALDNPNGEIPVSRFAGEPGFDKYQLDQVAIGYQLEHRFNDVFTVRQNARYAYIHNDSELVYGVGLNPADPQQRLLVARRRRGRIGTAIGRGRQPGAGCVRHRAHRPHRAAGRGLPVL
jgi:outer membrane receptor protein involved in Fe transport